MVVRIYFKIKFFFIVKNYERYAKNSSGRVGVIPENYVQALADPPEPNEPPPPLSTFSNTNNIFPSLDGFGSSNNNASRTSNPPPYDSHQYMNPASYNNWQPQESAAWPSLSSSPQPNVRYIIILLIDFYIIFI